MKRVFLIVAAVFAVLAIIFYVSSIRDVSGLQVANIQATIFAAACAVICALNIVGAFILDGIHAAENFFFQYMERLRKTEEADVASNK